MTKSFIQNPNEIVIIVWHAMQIQAYVTAYEFLGLETHPLYQLLELEKLKQETHTYMKYTKLRLCFQWKIVEYDWSE